MKASSRAERPGLLDANFVSRLSSSQNISKLEAKRLETQWKRICDHEKRSKERNKELLKDFDRVEQHAALLAVKTERLKAYKQQYESYINKMYPRWKEELENHRLSQLQGRNALTGSASVAPPLTSSLPLRAAQLEPQFSGNTLLTSTPAHPPPPSSTVQDRLPPQTGYPVNQHHSYRQDPYREFSYHDPSRQHGGNLPPSGYLVSDRRWESPEYYDSHRHFDGRVHQGQFAASSREPENVYYRSPEHYSASPGGPFYDRRPPHREVPRNVPPDFRYMNPDVRHGPEPQGTRPAAPYEPRTELKRTFLPDRNQPAPYDQDGHHALYHDRKQGGYSGYEDQRPNGFEPHRMERGIVNGRDEAKFDKPFLSGFPTKVIVNGQDSKQLSPEAYSINQPFVPPEKPLERSIPTSGFPDPSLSSTVVETSVDSRNTHHDHEMKEDKSFTTPTTSEATPNEALVKPAKETIVKQQSLPSEEITKLSEEVRTRGVEPVKSVGIPQEGNQNNTGIDLEGGKDEKPKDKVALTLQQSNKLEEQSDEDDEESLDLSDLSLPDGKKEGLPIIPSQKQPVRHEDKQEETNVFHRDSEVSGGTTNPVVVPDATKSVTEDISEDIPESMALDGDEELNDVPVHDEGEVRLTSSGGQVAEHAKEFEVSKDVNDEREEDKNEVQAKDEMETPAQKNEEEKTSSVSVDGFLCLLQAVDADVEVSFSPETLYRSPPCSSDMRDEIIRAAEVGDSLQSFDPNTVSMVVLEELPLLVSSSPAGCLIPDRVFSEGASFKTEKELRSFAESSLIKLWKALFSHLVNVVKNNVMRAEQVGNMFGSLLIAKSSKHWKEVGK